MPDAPHTAPVGRVDEVWALKLILGYPKDGPRPNSYAKLRLSIQWKHTVTGTGSAESVWWGLEDKLQPPPPD